MDAAANGWDFTFGHVADLTPTPSTVIDEGAQRTVRRYRSRRKRAASHAPLLLVPPLAAPATCFDLRRGCSLAEHFVGLGYPTYLVDYGAIAFSDRQLGLEHWVEDVLPTAVRAVSEDSGEPVQLVGWCLGGIMSLLALAAEPTLPVKSAAMVGSPFDFTQVRMMAPIRQLARLTGGALITGLYRTLGGAPAPLVSLGFQLTSIDRYLMKPLVVAQHLDDREWLAQVEAVDSYMANMLAYPGRTFGQMYHRFFIVNELAGGRMELSDRTVDLADVKQPVLTVSGDTDVLAPRAAVEHVEALLPNASEVRVERAPGGHLGVLSGRSAIGSTWRYLDEFLGAHDPVARSAPKRRTQARRAAA